MTSKFKALFSLRMLIVFAMGFSSGLPLLLIGSTLKVWFTEAKIDLTTIGFFALVGIPYTFKFVWSPFLDRYVPPFLGRRRGWLLISQLGLVGALVFLSTLDPTTQVPLIAAVALAIAFLSATQDIALDAYRREILKADEFAFGNSLAITAYRLAMLYSSGFALILADHVSWSTVYVIMGASMGVGILTTLLSPEPQVEHAPPRDLKEAFVEPFLEYFRRPGAWWLIAFILLYKVGESMASEMTMPFYRMLGFSKTEIGTIVKIFGIWALILGGIFGGAITLKIGLRKSLWVFGVLQAIGILGFAWLAQVGPNPTLLACVISMENFTAGAATAAFTAFMASMTNKRFTATQYALLSSLMGVPRVIMASPTGFMAEHLGWQLFFVTCTVLTIPGMLLLFKVGRLADAQEQEEAAANGANPSSVSGFDKSNNSHSAQA
jgi:PAT family beta-lactamase induction signal transducer AmpG